MPLTNNAAVSDTRPVAAITSRKPSAFTSRPHSMTFSSPSAPIQRPRRKPCTRTTPVPMNRNIAPISRAEPETVLDEQRKDRFERRHREGDEEGDEIERQERARERPPGPDEARLRRDRRRL